jgi:hypothetical protein
VWCVHFFFSFDLSQPLSPKLQKMEQATAALITNRDSYSVPDGESCLDAAMAAEEGVSVSVAASTGPG